MALDITIQNRFRGASCNGYMVNIQRNDRSGQCVGECISAYLDTRSYTLSQGESLMVWVAFRTLLPSSDTYFFVSYFPQIAGQVMFEANGDDAQGPISNFPDSSGTYEGYEDRTLENPKFVLTINGTGTDALRAVAVTEPDVILGEDDQ